MSVDLDDRVVQSLLARSVSALSTAAPFAVPEPRPGATVTHLLSGGPAAEALPLGDLADAHSAVLAGARGVAALQYSDSLGLALLRSTLAEREGVSPDRIVITNGALHGVWLALGAVLDRGDVVVVDDPVFPDTPRIIEAAGGIVHPVPVDREGIDIAAIEALIADGVRLKAVYTVADFHNPSGHTLTVTRRERLVELAQRHGFLVVSDNPYRQHRLLGTEVADFTASSDHVVRINTFSKTLGPGLRLGWIVAPSWLAPHLVNVRRRVDFHSSTLTQHVVAELLRRPGWFEQLGRSAREIYGRRAQALTSSLRSHVPELLRFDEPEGGFFVWAEVTDPVITADALADVGPRLAQVAGGLRATWTGGRS